MSHNRPRVPTEEEIEQEREVLKLRRAGVSNKEIARQLNVDPATTRRRFKNAMARTLREPAHEIRQLEEERLDRLQQAVWVKAMRGDHGAVDRVLRVMARRAELLGLDHSHGIAERQLALEAEKVRLVAIAFGKALDSVDLDPGQREQMTQVLLTELRAGVADGGESGDAEGDNSDNDGVWVVES